MKMNRYLPGNLPALLLPLLLLQACQWESDWLDIKRNKGDVVPETLSDFRALLDNTNIFNRNYPTLGLLGADNFYLTDKEINEVTPTERNVYLWEQDLFEDRPATDFTDAYLKIGYANIILQGVDKHASEPTSQEYRTLKGEALFHRASALYGMAQLYCSPYTPENRAKPGLQLRTSTDPADITPRSSVEQTYAFIIDDLIQAAELLVHEPVITTRPGPAAIFSLLARVYLVSGDYQKAGDYAEKVLETRYELLDFNTLKDRKEETFVFPAYNNLQLNPEIIFYANGMTFRALWPVYTVSFLDSTLYDSYQDLDLRKTLFFKRNPQGRQQATGSYTGSYFGFSGIAFNEILLIAAECAARQGNVARGEQLLNDLLEKRYEDHAFVPVSYSSPESLLDAVVTERRKELPFTGQIRWEDLRRLNREERFKKQIVRYYQGEQYVLLPTSNRYVFPLPNDEVRMNGIVQNPRD